MSAKLTVLTAALCIVALAAISAGRHQVGEFDNAGDTGTACSASDSFVPCGTVIQWGHPVGDGLIAISIDDFI